jgi:inosine-uridine nucleoside N-ribohydrolase
LIILDTDIGIDVGDPLAVSLVLTSPELALAGVTIVYGAVYVGRRAR